MIFQYLDKINKMKIVLASGSPRRKEILQNIGLNISIVPSTFEENLHPSDYTHPSVFVLATAEEKAREVANRLTTREYKPDIIIGADTCVCYNKEVYGKPSNKDEAFNVLSKLSDDNHEVITGVFVLVKDGKNWKEHKISESTSVKFAPLSESLIKAYIDTGEPMDKAGGYGIQALGGALIEGIVGDYYNVMGFPIHKFTKLLCEIFEETLK